MFLCEVFCSEIIYSLVEMSRFGHMNNYLMDYGHLRSHLSKDVDFCRKYISNPHGPNPKQHSH